MEKMTGICTSVTDCFEYFRSVARSETRAGNRKLEVLLEWLQNALSQDLPVAPLHLYTIFQSGI